MTVYIILTTAGADTGPFNIYSDVDGYLSAFETGVSKASLLAGYTSSLAPNGTTIVRVKSAGTCTNYIDITIVPCSITTTTTTTLEPVAGCAIYDLTGGIGGGSWTALECGTLTFVGGDIGEGVTISSGCIETSSLTLTNVSSLMDAVCFPVTTTTTTAPVTCTNYTVTNTDLSIDLYFDYINCIGLPVMSIIVSPGNNTTVCAQTGTVVIASGIGTITPGSSCS